jgi:hypothetical protein
MRQTNPRISGGPFDNCPAGLEQAFVLCVFDDVQRSTVFHRTTRVEKLCFSQDLTPGLFAEGVEANKRCVTDCSDKSFADAHGKTPFLNTCQFAAAAVAFAARKGEKQAARPTATSQSQDKQCLKNRMASQRAKELHKSIAGYTLGK